MQNTTPDLAALIGSRICHDLISPIGAINNGLELLGMSGDASGPELGLISESVENASARIRFFRLAFGAASPQDVPVQEVRGVLSSMTRNARLAVSWLPDQPAARSDVRVALLAEQCLETAMPFGGEITVDRDTSGWLLRGEAVKFNVDKDLWTTLAACEVLPDIEPSHVHFALLAVHCHNEGRRLATEIGDEEITIRF